MAPKKKNSSKNSSAKSQAPVVPDSSHIVFGDDNKKTKQAKSASSSKDAPLEPAKSTARQIVGGASWTGKLPVNLLSEHCQRQKWNKPDYSMRHLPGNGDGEKMYRSDVTLSKTDPKTRESTKLPPIRLPQSDVQLADEASVLEARHFAATYALFRLQSMKNIHMALPPKYRDLWKGEFARLKKADIEAGQGWKYDEDPFAAETKRQEILRSIEKRKEEDKKKQDIENGKTDVKGVGTIPTGKKTQSDRMWQNAPHAAMGQQIRIDIEGLVRESSVWNRYNTGLSKEQQNQVIKDVIELGFRQSHVEEALEFCKDKEEVLEWLLVHVPEDDLPTWTFPTNYNAGVILASGDMAKEGKLKRLALAGYPSDLCVQALRINNGNEVSAAFDLQEILVPAIKYTPEEEPNSHVVWKEEMDILASIFGDNLTITGAHQCSILLSSTSGQPFRIHFTCPRNGYPEKKVPAISIEVAAVPAYVRLSVVKNTILYAYAELLGEVMVYSICQWLELEMPDLLNKPGRLSELHIASKAASAKGKESSSKDGKGSTHYGTKEITARPPRLDNRPDAELLDRWNTRQSTHEQMRMVQARQNLPAWTQRDQIMQQISSKKVTIISGETGSGKSTQVVQFVLDDAIQQLRGSRANILCTQPRRVAAISLADRVSSERCSTMGDEVGYVIRGESKVSTSTKITFMTIGVLLRRLQSFASIKDALTNVSHIFIDEVHERSLDTDFLLALLKEYIAEQPKLKIVLMSATLDADIFRNYFGGSSNVASVFIEGRTFPVHDLYLEEIVGHTRPDVGNADIGKTIQGLGFGINYDFISELVHHIDQELGDQTGSILIFLPGTMEIERCLRAIRNSSRFLALPLHASLLSAEQRKVFPRAPTGQRKVVAATNVAETSITIEDVVAVIDTGKVKETSYDAINNIVRLEETWASQAACKQRRGRAGRVRAGTCYKLFTRNTEAKMPAKSLPEIQRVPLEQLCLSVKATDPSRNVADFLSRTLTPPDNGAVSNAIKTLHTMNALENNRLTALGKFLATIPTDLRCAKLIIYGALFDCLEPCLTIASILTVKSPFVNPKDKREEANAARLKFSSFEGDLMLDLQAYDKWFELSQTMRHHELSEWCTSHFISQQTMRDISSTRRQILDSLKESGIVPFRHESLDKGKSAVKSTDQVILLTALIAGSLQPQIAEISFPSKKYIASLSGAKELDPEAKTIKFFIPDESSMTPSHSTPINSRSGTPGPDSPSLPSISVSNTSNKMPSYSRVFIHPASCLFSTQSFPNHATHMSYFTKMVTTKPFIRDLTPLNLYSLLLFGGKLELDTSGRGLTVGGAWRIQGWARIGVLISRLRVLLDEELGKNIESGGILLESMGNSRVVQLVKKLLILNGQDQ